MDSTASTEALTARLTALAEDVGAALGDWLSRPGTPLELAEAMRYAALAGGKRLRPAMVHLAAEAVSDGAPTVDPMPAAMAVELVHCYSLVHDDLPAMDDDTLRRGRPTVHVAYGEAMAILAGDALLTDAFELLVTQVQSPATASALVGELARGAGGAGMIAGQVADMDLCKVPDGRDGLEYIHLRKTGALIVASLRMGGICGGADEARLDALGAFGRDLGLAFQVVDDLLDETESSEQLGKTAGKDAAAGKRTYPALLGLDAAARAAEQLSTRALSHLAPLGERAQTLHDLAGLLLRRTS